LTGIGGTSISIEPSSDLRVSRDPAEVGRHGKSRHISLIDLCVGEWLKPSAATGLTASPCRGVSQPGSVGSNPTALVQQSTSTMKLTDPVIDAIRRYKRASPKATYKEMAQKFGLSIPSIVRALGAGEYRKPLLAEPAPTKARITPQPAGSCIRPIPLSRLMAGR
jgi:hypothetical protein